MEFVVKVLSFFRRLSDRVVLKIETFNKKRKAEYDEFLRKQDEKIRSILQQEVQKQVTGFVSRELAKK